MTTDTDDPAKPLPTPIPARLLTASMSLFNNTHASYYKARDELTALQAQHGGVPTPVSPASLNTVTTFRTAAVEHFMDRVFRETTTNPYIPTGSTAADAYEELADELVALNAQVGNLAGQVAKLTKRVCSAEESVEPVEETDADEDMDEDGRQA